MQEYELAMKELSDMSPESVRNKLDAITECFMEYHKSMLGARSCLIAAQSVTRNTDLPEDIPTHIIALSKKTINLDMKTFISELSQEKLSWR